MTSAEFLAARGLRTVTLPSSGATVEIRRPKTRELMRIGLFPLKVSRMEMSKIDPDEKEHLLKEAERSAIKLICECSVSPRFVQREPKPGRDEARIETLDDDDFAALNAEILDLAGSEAEEPPTPDDLHLDDNMKALGLCCKMFGIDPTAAEEWEPDRVQRLFRYAALTVEK
jgi:hypothetical protein